MTKDTVSVSDDCGKGSWHYGRITGRERYREQQGKAIGDIYGAKTSSQNSLFQAHPLMSRSVKFLIPLKTAEVGISIHNSAKIMAAQRVRRLPLMK